MSGDVTERYTPRYTPVLSPALSQTSRGQRGKRERLGTRLVLTLKTNCIKPSSYASTAYVVVIRPSFLSDSFVKIWATCEIFLGKWFTAPPPWPKISPTPMTGNLVAECRSALSIGKPRWSCDNQFYLYWGYQFMPSASVGKGGESSQQTFLRGGSSWRSSWRSNLH